MDAREASIALAGSRNAAVALVTNRIVDLGTTDVGAIGAFIAELTTKIHEAYLPQLQAALNMTAAPAAPPAVAPATTVPAPGGPAQQAVAAVAQAMPGSALANLPPAPEFYQYDGRGCPVCAENGRAGQLLQSTDMTFKGPEFKCNMVRREKQGTQWVDVGQCQYQEWGRNAR